MDRAGLCIIICFDRDWQLLMLDGMPGAGKTTFLQVLVPSLHSTFGENAINVTTKRGIVATLAGIRTFAYMMDPMGTSSGCARPDAQARHDAALFGITVIDEIEEWSHEEFVVSSGINS
jgi:hypothetical protein